MEERKRDKQGELWEQEFFWGYINYLEQGVEKKRKWSHKLRVHEESGEKNMMACSETFPSMESNLSHMMNRYSFPMWKLYAPNRVHCWMNCIAWLNQWVLSVGKEQGQGPYQNKGPCETTAEHYLIVVMPLLICFTSVMSKLTLCF